MKYFQKCLGYFDKRAFNDGCRCRLGQVKTLFDLPQGPAPLFAGQPVIKTAQPIAGRKQDWMRQQAGQTAGAFPDMILPLLRYIPGRF